MSHTAVQPPAANFQRLWSMVGILLIATAFRFFAIDSAPPGWRDDELIEYTMDRRIADGWRPLFITEAEGHEPVYHYLHAATIVLFGDNLIGYKWLPLAFGLLTLALTYALARKMFGGRVAFIAAALLAVSFWPVMYARFGVRHIGTLPWLLAAMVLLYPPRMNSRAERGNTLKRVLTRLEYQPSNSFDGVGRIVLAGICLAAGLMTYFAGRAVPLILAGFLGYLLIFHRSILKRVWWHYAAAIALGALLAAPMFIEIANTPGAERRTEVVGGPLIELRKGNVQPAIETTLGTLGMFTFAGDPESLYNVPGRPVFDWITGAFFYLGVLVCFIRLKRIESGFALAWLVIGIAPAFVSVPAASFSHTIAALPVVYVITAIGVVTISDKMTRGHDDKMTSHRQIILSRKALHPVILSGIVLLNGALTLRDYFGTWANDDFVRFQYHAPTREIAQWLDQNPQITDVAIGTHVTQLELDPVALELDVKRAGMKARWFNAETALVLPPSRVVIVSALQPMGDSVREIVETTGNLLVDGPGFKAYSITAAPRDVPPLGAEFDGGRLSLSIALRSAVRGRPGELMVWRTYWTYRGPLSIQRAKMFFHVLDGQGQVIVGDDREDLNFATVRAGDEFWQISSVTLPNDLPPGQYAIEIGWYHPETGARLKQADGSDRFLLPPLDVVAP